VVASGTEPATGSTPLWPPPGGDRFTQWEIAAPGGAFVAAGVGGGFNIYFIRNPLRGDMRGYIQPVGGVGGGVALPGLRMVWNLVQNIVTGMQYSNPDFTAVTSCLPVTWEELEKCLVRVSSVGAGAVFVGGAAAVVTFTSSKVWQWGPHGAPWNVEAGDLFQFRTIGKSWQLGVGGSVVAGPLVRVG